MRNRAQRRTYTRLKKLKVARYGVAWYFYDGVCKNPRTLGKVATTPKACGCWMCNRPRKRFGMSHAEIVQRLRGCE